MKIRKMKVKLLFLGIISLITISWLSCKKCDCHLPGNMFNPINFSFKINDTILTDSTYLSKIKLYYYDGNRYVDNANDIDPDSRTIYDNPILFDFSTKNNHLPEQKNGECKSVFLTNISANRGIKTFYFKFPDSQIDTLELDAEKVSYKQSKQELCHCAQPIRRVLFNGKIPNFDTINKDFIGEKSYIFKK